jgi:transposase
MTRPYSVDLRERVVRAVEAGASCRSAALKFEVSVSFVIKLMQRWRRRGSVAPDRYGGWKRSALADHAEGVRALLMVAPDLTIAELRRRLADQGIATSPAAISRFLSAAGLTRKKGLAGCLRHLDGRTIAGADGQCGLSRSPAPCRTRGRCPAALKRAHEPALRYSPPAGPCCRASLHSKSRALTSLPNPISAMIGPTPSTCSPDEESGLVREASPQDGSQRLRISGAVPRAGRPPRSSRAPALPRSAAGP